MKKSINIGFFGNDVPLDTVFSKLAALGFKGAELNMTDTQHTYPNLYNGVSDEETAAVGELLKKHSLECVGIVTDQLWTYHLTSDDAKIRNEAIDRIKKMIHIANVLGASSVLVVPGIINENVTYKNAYANAIESLKILAPIAEKAGVKLGIEDVWNKFLLSPYEMAGFIDKVGSTFVGAYFDVGNVVINSYPEYWIEILANRITRIHVKGFNNKNNTFCYLHEGTINWDKVIAELKKINYNGFITAELWPRPDGNIDADLKQISDDIDKILK